MPQIVDVFGNPFKGALDPIGGEVFTETGRSYSQTIGAVNAEVVMDLNGHSVAMFDLRTAALNGTVVFEGSVNGTDYFGLPGLNLLTEAYLAAIIVTTGHAAAYVVGCSGLRKVRARISAWTSGNIAVAMRASFADFAIYARLFPSPLSEKQDGGANASATLTLPAAGAGLFHYITHIDIRRVATAALTGSAILAVTSTNLPGAWTCRVGNAMAIGGTQIDLSQSFSSPLKSSVANTATTIVGPAAGAAVSWSLRAHYYVGA